MAASHLLAACRSPSRRCVVRNYGGGGRAAANSRAESVPGNPSPRRSPLRAEAEKSPRRISEDWRIRVAATDYPRRQKNRTLAMSGSVNKKISHVEAPLQGAFSMSCCAPDWKRIGSTWRKVAGCGVAGLACGDNSRTAETGSVWLRLSVARSIASGAREHPELSRAASSTGPTFSGGGMSWAAPVSAWADGCRNRPREASRVGRRRGVAPQTLLN